MGLGRKQGKKTSMLVDNKGDNVIGEAMYVDFVDLKTAFDNEDGNKMFDI